MRRSIMGKYEELKDLPTISSERVVNENVIGSLKRFKIISDTYKNRRKRFDLRFNLIAGIYNYEIKFIKREKNEVLTKIEY